MTNENFGGFDGFAFAAERANLLPVSCATFQAMTFTAFIRLLFGREPVPEPPLPANFIPCATFLQSGSTDDSVCDGPRLSEDDLKGFLEAVAAADAMVSGQKSVAVAKRCAQKWSGLRPNQ